MRRSTRGLSRRVRVSAALLPAILMLFCFASVAVAEPNIVLTVSPNPVEVGEEVQVALSAHGSIDSIDEPLAEGLSFQSAGRQQSTSWENGRVTSKIKVFFVAYPERPGTYKVGPVRGYLRGKVVAESKQVLLQVKAGPELQPSSPGDLQLSDYEGRAAFLVGRVPKPTVVVGEPFLYEMDLYVRKGLKISGGEWTQPPRFGGFKREDLMRGRDATRYRRERKIGRTRYDVYPVERSLLVPLSAGSRLLGEARKAIFLPSGRLRRRKKVIRSRPVRLEVIETPRKGRSASYKSGVVGAWVMTGNLDKTTVQAGGRIILDVEISGEGNQDALPVPSVVVPDGVRVETIPGRDCPMREIGGHGITGKCRFQFVLVPLVSGRRKVGPVQFPFFNIKTRRYETASAGPWWLDVSAGDARVRAGGTRAAKVIPREVKDPPFLDRLDARSAHRDLPRPPAPLLGYGVPIILFILITALGRWSARRKEDPLVAIRAVVARSRSDIRRAHKMGAEQGGEAIDRAMRDVLVAMFAVDPRGMPRERIRVRLQERSVTGALAREVVDLLETVESLRYGGAGDLVSLQGDALGLLARLKAEI